MELKIKFKQSLIKGSCFELFTKLKIQYKTFDDTTLCLIVGF